METFEFLRHVRIAVGSADPWCSAILFDLVRYSSMLFSILGLLVCCSKTIRSYVIFILVASFLLFVGFLRALWLAPGFVVRHVCRLAARVACDMFDLPSCYCHPDRHGSNTEIDDVIRENKFTEAIKKPDQKRQEQQGTKSNRRSSVLSAHEKLPHSASNIDSPGETQSSDRNSKSSTDSRSATRPLPLQSGISKAQLLATGGIEHGQEAHSEAESSSNTEPNSIFDKVEGRSSPGPISSDNLEHEIERVASTKDKEPESDVSPTSNPQDQQPETFENSNKHAESVSDEDPDHRAESLQRSHSIQSKTSQLSLSKETGIDRSKCVQRKEAPEQCICVRCSICDSNTHICSCNYDIHVIRTGPGMPLLQWRDNVFLADLENKQRSSAWSTKSSQELTDPTPTTVAIHGQTRYIIVIRHPLIVLSEIFDSSALFLRFWNPIPWIASKLQTLISWVVLLFQFSMSWALVLLQSVTSWITSTLRSSRDRFAPWQDSLGGWMDWFLQSLIPAILIALFIASLGMLPWIEPWLLSLNPMFWVVPLLQSLNPFPRVVLVLQSTIPESIMIPLSAPLVSLSTSWFALLLKSLNPLPWSDRPSFFPKRWFAVWLPSLFPMKWFTWWLPSLFPTSWFTWRSPSLFPMSWFTWWLPSRFPMGWFLLLAVSLFPASLVTRYTGPLVSTEWIGRFWRQLVQNPVSTAWSSLTTTVNNQYIKILSWLEPKESSPYIEITTDAEIRKVIDELKTLPPGEPLIAIDMVGVNLGRWGTSCFLSIRDCLHENTYLIDLLELGKNIDSTERNRAFTIKNTNAVTLKDIFEDNTIKKMIFDCRQDSHALFWQFGVKLVGIVDLQYTRMLTASECPKNRPGLFHTLMDGSILSASDRRKFIGVKDCVGKNFWLYEQRPCLEDVKIYAVNRVRYLHQLYECKKTTLGPDRMRLAEQWSAVEILRTQDENWKLAKVKVLDGFEESWSHEPDQKGLLTVLMNASPNGRIPSWRMRELHEKFDERSGVERSGSRSGSASASGSSGIA